MAVAAEVPRDPEEDNSVPRTLLTLELAPDGVCCGAGAFTLLSNSWRLDGRLQPPEDVPVPLRKDRPVSVGSELSKKGMPEASAVCAWLGVGGRGGVDEDDLPIESWMACKR